MEDRKIHLPARRVTGNAQGCIKLTREAMEALAEVANETNLSMRMVASEIILQAVNNGMISFDRDEIDQ